MPTNPDDRGWISLSKDLRDRHGERFRVVDLPSGIILVPVDGDPIEAVRESVGAAFEGKDIGDLSEDARVAIASFVAGESVASAYSDDWYAQRAGWDEELPDLSEKE